MTTEQPFPAADDNATAADSGTEPAQKAPARRSRAKKVPEVASAEAGPEPTSGEDGVAEPLTAEAPARKAPVRRSRAKKVPTELSAEQDSAGGIVPEADVEVAAKAPVRRSRARKTATADETPTATVGAPPATADAGGVAVSDPSVAPTEPGDTQAVEAAVVLPPVSPVSLLFQAPDLSAAIPAVSVSSDATEEGEPEDSDGGRRRNSRNSRNRRNRTARTDETRTDDTAGEGSEPAESDSAGEDSSQENSDGTTSRRRRRRRRGEADLELTGGNENDPPNTVTRVRAPRQHVEAPVSDKVTSLRGSTRLEAKKQRRRESRDSGRRRQVITEAEFLARRESVDRSMIVRQRDDRIQIGVLEDGILAEHFVSKTQQDSLIGNVYLGKVQNVLPSMEAAFVDIGRGRNAVLYAGEVNWDVAKLDGAPRRIENALKSGDSVLVQVTKDPVGHKGARLTSQISLPGRYLVYVPGGSMTGISRKLPDVERNRLKRILKDHLPESAGVIVRTAAEGASEEELTHDINRLRVQWEGIESRAASTKTLAPEMLYGEPDLTIKVVRDVFNEDFTKLIVSGDEAWDTVEAYVTYVAPDLVDRLEKWTKDEDIFAAYRIEEQIAKALERKVYLPSGGSLVIDRTEAMTVVDVNTGKFTGSGGNLEETVTKNNLEAAEEVVRQLRLRDIGGIIVIDFIDMVLESNRDLVLRRLVECLGRDRTKHQVAEVTSLGLIQMTRKRMGTGLLEVFGEECEHCAGRGVVTHEEPVEHRRSQHGHAAESHQPPVRAEQSSSSQRPSRGEKKRGRGRGAGSVAEPTSETAPVIHSDGLSEEERQAKANAARAALATIAAATHAAHGEHPHSEHPHDAGTHDGAAPDRTAGVGTLNAGVPAPAAVQPANDTPRQPDIAPDPSSSDEKPPVVTFGGEPVPLPRGHQGSEPAVDPAVALAGLASVLDRIAEVPESEDHSGLTAEGQPNGTRPRRNRRNRGASRPQGAANTNEVQQRSGTAHPVPHLAAAAHGTADNGHGAAESTDTVEELAPAQAAPKAAEPIILGVGVPASEL